jgi:inorganic pyrophosphatase
MAAANQRNIMTETTEDLEKKIDTIKARSHSVGARDYLGKEVEIIIDRPLGSKHPKHDIVYGVNYGFVPNTMSADGEEIDAYLLGESQPVSSASGKCVAIIRRTDDDDDKLVIAANGHDEFTDAEIIEQTHFQEKYFKSIIIR